LAVIAHQGNGRTNAMIGHHKRLLRFSGASITVRCDVSQLIEQ
jgi:hypothetical protein